MRRERLHRKKVSGPEYGLGRSRFLVARGCRSIRAISLGLIACNSSGQTLRQLFGPECQIPGCQGPRFCVGNHRAKGRALKLTELFAFVIFLLLRQNQSLVRTDTLKALLRQFLCRIQCLHWLRNKYPTRVCPFTFGCPCASVIRVCLSKNVLPLIGLDLSRGLRCRAQSPLVE